MLVLGRKRNETIVISGNLSAKDGSITIRILDTEPGKTKIGIDAPKGVSIVRGELLEKPVKKGFLTRFFKRR